MKEENTKVFPSPNSSGLQDITCRADIKGFGYEEACDHCAYINEGYPCVKLARLFQNRIDRLAECGEEHKGINSTKKQAISHLIDIAKGISH
jgi:hypothetical protein